jgi:hypothetical protein
LGGVRKNSVVGVALRVRGLETICSECGGADAVGRHGISVRAHAAGIDNSIGDGSNRGVIASSPVPVERSSSRWTTIAVTSGWLAKRTDSSSKQGS